MNSNNFLKFKRLLRFVWENKYSDFYRTKYKKAGFNPITDFNSIADVKKIPFLIREELSSADLTKLLFVNENEIDVISPTSGTTGKSFFTFHSKYDIVPDIHNPVYFGKVIMILTSHFRSTLFYESLKNSKNRENWLFTGDIHNLPASCQMAEQLGVNTIITTPTMAILLKDYIERYPNLKKSLKYFRLFGELLGLEKNKLLHELYPNLEIILSHGLSETRLTAIQCLYLARRGDEIYYHQAKDFDYYLECINQNSGKNTAMGERGEFIITTFWNSATPIIRYKTEDIISLKKNNCPCKASGPLLQFWGRKNRDTVRAGGVEFRTDALEKPLVNLINYVRDAFEVHIYEMFSEDKPKLKIILKLFLKDGVRESEKIKQKINKEFTLKWQISPRLNFEKAVDVGIFEPLQINFDKLPQLSKSKKIIILH
jgi:phenylacetate-CoA ligase